MRLLPWLFALVVASSSVLAAEFYADVLFDVQPDGTVDISGTTNHPLLAERATQEFTSKSKQYWILNLTLPEQFSDYIFTVRLPAGSTVNYVNSKNVNIYTDGEHVILKSVGSNAPLSIVTQYTIANKKVDYLIEILGSVLAAAFICGILLLAHWRGGKQREKLEKMHKPTKAITLVDGLSERQKDIVRLLERSNGALTQKQIEQELKLPKASVSRNIESLRRRGLLEKQQSGMTNVVKLKT